MVRVTDTKMFLKMITPPKANPNRRYHNVGSTVDAAFSVCTEFTV
jgi:hypothetical protein